MTTRDMKGKIYHPPQDRPSEEAVQREGGIPLKVADATDKPPFVPSKGLTTVEAEQRLLQYGKNELQDKQTPKVRLIPWMSLSESFQNVLWRMYHSLL